MDCLNGLDSLTVRKFREPVTPEVMAEAIDDSNELLDLLRQWIDTRTWQESHDVLQQNSELLLSDDMLALLDELLAVNQDEMR